MTTDAQATSQQTPPPPTGMPYGYAPQPAGAGYGFARPVAVPPKKKPIWLIVLLVVLGIVVALGVGGFWFGAIGNPTSQKIGVIEIDGTIGQDSGANTPEGLLSQLNKAEHDPMLAAVVLRVNSGGGAAAAGEEMARYVKDFSKPVVVSSASGNASAAYMISSQADYIYANEASSVGAIGTVIQLTNYSRLLTLLGVDVRTITSAESKDSTYGTRALTDEEIKYYQAQVDQINKNFIETVADGRNMEIETVKKLATGMAFTGEDAKENGLIDEIGTFKDACNKAAQLAGIGSYHIESLGNNDLSIADLLAALLMNTNEKSSASLANILEGAPVYGQLS